jgi:serine/threonine protein kinase
MGVVYLAEQEQPIRRRVALKLIKLGMDTKEVVGRFESERQALAMMDHPNIAKVLDAGATQTGRPFFVMEYVAGEAIHQYCDRHRLSTKERLELFAPVCRAVHHAHQKGVIHRDIKPTNILVTVQDGKPTPKVIDFGVAKALSQRLTERTVYTEQGRLIGTPEYMSPEQAEMTGLNVDTTTDVYSLGVVLYELLVGALPFEPRVLRAAGMEAMHHIIREVDPPTPSSRLSTLGDDAVVVAKHRHTEARALLKQVRGELDWITMRAMEKDRTQRYQSASELAADIVMHLNGNPVLAGPPSAIYRVRRVLKKHRKVTRWAISALVVGVLAAAATLAVVQTRSVRKREAQQVEEIQWTLEEVVRTREKPESFQPNWLALQPMLHAKVEEDPTGPLAVLAMRASMAVSVELPSFGRFASLPFLALDIRPTLDPGRDFLCTGRIEASWDGSPWSPVVFCRARWRTRAGGFSSYGGKYGLREIILKETLASGPHRLDLRLHLDFVDVTRDSASWKVLEPQHKRFVERWESRPWPESIGEPVLVQEVVDLGSHDITLLDEYPNEFPYAVFETDDVGSPQAWFRVRSMRLYRVVLPSGSGSEYSFDGPSGCSLTQPVPPQASATEGFPAAMEVAIRDELLENPPLPIASRSTLYLDDASPLVEFNVILGIKGMSLSELEGPPPLFGWGNICSEDWMEGRTRYHTLGIFFSVRPGDRYPQCIGPLPRDGTYSGRLHLVPSRELARETLAMDRYYGLEFSVPVEVEILTVPGEWGDAN